MFELAAKYAFKENELVRRTAWHGAVGVRTCGTKVYARNLPSISRNRNAHAETLLTRKLDAGSIVYVARINREGKFCNSRPCQWCQLSMKFAGVKKVYYTVNDTEHGVMEF